MNSSINWKCFRQDVTRCAYNGNVWELLFVYISINSSHIKEAIRIIHFSDGSL